jgi:hypothetical protein
LALSVPVLLLLTNVVWPRTAEAKSTVTTKGSSTRRVSGDSARMARQRGVFIGVLQDTKLFWVVPTKDGALGYGGWANVGPESRQGTTVIPRSSRWLSRSDTAVKDKSRHNATLCWKEQPAMKCSTVGLWNDDPNNKVQRYSSERTSNILLIAAEALAYFASAHRPGIHSQLYLQVTLHEFEIREESFSVVELLETFSRHPPDVAQLTSTDARTLKALWTSLCTT